MADIMRQYQKKLITADQAAQLVKSGDMVQYSEFAMFPDALDEALAKRKDELENVTIRSTSFTKAPEPIVADPERKHFIMEDYHFSVVSRCLHDKNLCNYVPFTYHQGPRMVRKYNDIDAAFIMVGPMDARGFFNLGPSNSITPAVMNKSKIIVLEVNKSVPLCLGGNQESIHISSVDYIIEGGNRPLIQLPVVQISETDEKIAGIIMNEIEDGSCLQLGIGGLPNAVGALIAESDLKDLGVHTEMLVDSYVDLYNKGHITGARKTIDKNKMVYTFAMGTNKVYDFLDNNPFCASYPADYTNDPRIIALNDKVVAINNCLEVDLFTQVCSETAGTRQISGTGGQLDFIFGAFNSHGGKGLICMSSTYSDKEGKVHSRIKPTLAPGSVVTVPRSLNQYIVTEYGIAQFKGKSTWQRAEALIEIAHPGFRDELIRSAQEMKIWRPTNKI
ncbi:MAG: acetyl-CoA hydrolase/transferase C-terminal domain-containing protein [Syntrophomonadaceae bacterium]|nr:acetyl-CoA hydrolase/transferase C-terminal domain-containing protein [Syntrophomonadaceae bacterium]